MFDETELWRDIPGYEDRQASTAGRIRKVSTGEIVTPYTNKGYQFITLRIIEGRYIDTVPRTVHYLAMLTFVGERPDGMHINHKNGIKTDNRVENLEYCTPAENSRHAADVLKRFSGITRRGGKLTTEQVREIRQRYANGGETHNSLAKAFGVSKCSINEILQRRAWKYI